MQQRMSSKVSNAQFMSQCTDYGVSISHNVEVSRAEVSSCFYMHAVVQLRRYDSVMLSTSVNATERDRKSGV